MTDFPSRKGQSRVLRARAKRGVVFLSLFAFVLQALIVQTHIHAASPEGAKLSSLDFVAAQAAETLSDDAHKAPGKYPATGDSDSCLVCQKLQTNGQYLSPQAAHALPLFVRFHIIPLHLAAAQLSALVHSWNSRAPPRL